MSMPPEPQTAVCLGCGCLCDHVLVRLDQDGRVVDAEGPCVSCRSWFLSGEGDPAPCPPAEIDDAPASFEDALEAAASLLRAARSPLLYNLWTQTNEALAAAYALADRVGAAVEPLGGRGDTARILATLRLGSMTASWGEIRSRADLILFWGGGWPDRQRCFWDRFVCPPGRFIPDGRAGRTILAAGRSSDEFSATADHTLIVPKDRQAETLHLLNWLASGGTADPGRAEASTGVPFGDLEIWASALRSSRYGAIVFDPGLLWSPVPQAAIEAMFQLVRSRNVESRFVATWLYIGGNPAGAEAVLTRQASVPGFVDYASGAPRFLPLDATFSHRATANEFDLLIQCAGPYITFVCNSKAPLLGRNLPYSVTLPTSTPGLDTPGTITRSDEIPIPLRPLRPATLPSAEALLTQLLHRLEPRP